MTETPTGFRLSSARRGGPGFSFVLLAAGAVVLLVAVLAVLNREPEPEVAALQPVPTEPPSPSPEPTTTAVPPTPAEQSSGWFVASSPEATATPWSTSPPPASRQPTPTPAVADCVTYSWTTAQIFNRSAQVLTEINAVNRCNRDIAPRELMFEVTGWRGGGRVQSVRALPFDSIRRNHSGLVSVGLPGSLDWYDEITVEIVE
jgi:hypothetical protein